MIRREYLSRCRSQSLRAAAHRSRAAVLAAVAKEAWDMLGNGTPDVMDAFATIAGGALVTVCLM